MFYFKWSGILSATLSTKMNVCVCTYKQPVPVYTLELQVNRDPIFWYIKCKECNLDRYTYSIINDKWELTVT